MTKKTLNILKKLRKLETILTSQQESIKKDITHERDHICFLESNLRRLQSANERLRKARQDTITLRPGSSVGTITRSFSRKSKNRSFCSPSALKNKLKSNEMNSQRENFMGDVNDVSPFKTGINLQNKPYFQNYVSSGGNKENLDLEKNEVSLQNKLAKRRIESRKSYNIGAHLESKKSLR